MIKITQLKSERWTDRKKAASQLGKLEDEEEVEDVIPEMIKALETDENSKVRAEIASSLSKMGEMAENAIPSLADAMVNDKNKDVREWATIAIGEMGAKAKKAIPQLIKVMEEDESPKVRKKAIFALGKMGEEAKKAVPALEKFMKENDGWWVEPIVNQTIKKITNPEVEEEKKY